MGYISQVTTTCCKLYVEAYMQPIAYNLFYPFLMENQQSY